MARSLSSGSSRRTHPSKRLVVADGQLQPDTTLLEETRQEPFSLHLMQGRIQHTLTHKYPALRRPNSHAIWYPYTEIRS